MPVDTDTSQQPLLVIYTGGTIGMQQSSQGYTPCANINELIQNSTSPSTYAHLLPFKTLEFDQLIDSSNAQPNDWLKIALCIQQNYQDFAGFIVLHGTDTMAYSAAALHHLFGPTSKPIIVTGSQIPMCETRSDAITNFIDAVAFCRSIIENASSTRAANQVCISFGGKLLAGNRAKKVHSSDLQAFNSLNSAPLATANIKIECNTSERTVEDNYSLIDSFNISNKKHIDSTSVKLLFIHPGISKQVIDSALLSPCTKAVVMLTYGAGNPPDQNTDLIDALTQARQADTVVINMTQCYAGSVAQGTYAVGSILNELGVISAGSRTLEDVVTDLYLNTEKYRSNR